MKEECEEQGDETLNELRTTLKSALDRVAPGTGTEIVAQRAAVLSGETARRNRRYIWIGGGLGVAAAAAAVMLVAGPAGSPPPQVPAPPVPVTEAATPVAVEVPEGKNAIVFNTSNPSISVVWIY